MVALEILTKKRSKKSLGLKDQTSRGVLCSQMNERITKNIVRDILKANQKKYSKVIIDEQIPENPRLKKLLKHASKSGLGGGEVLSLLLLLKKYLI